MNHPRNSYGFPAADPRDAPRMGVAERRQEVLLAIPAEIPHGALAEALAHLGLVIDPVRDLRPVVRTRWAEEARR